MSYTFLLFDLDHTLLDFEAGEEVALGLLLDEVGFADHAAFKAVYKPMNQAMWKALERKEITKTELINTRFSKAFAHFGITVDGAVLAERFQFYMGQQGQVFDGALALLEKLTSLGYQLYAATNGVTAIQQGRLQQSGLLPFFRQVFISERLGTQKPEADFFEKIAEQIDGFSKAKALMIGDSLTADIAGGNRSGMDTVWYNRENDTNTSSSCPTYTVKTYEELLALLSV